jgi:very-short-patch-repair endonuclease
MTGMRDAKGRIVFTKCERQLLDQLQKYRQNGLIRYPITPQFEVKFGSVVYPIDFALPHLKIALEADGEAFHSSPKQLTHDKERDMKLSSLGWTVLRFTDSEIEDQVERVMSTILKTIMQKEASLEKQKASIK